MQKVFNVAVDIGRKLPAPAFEVNTNDLKSVKLLITITNGQTLLDLTDTTVRIAIRKPDNNILFQDCAIKDAKNGQVEIVLENQAYIMAGTHTAEIMCYKGNDVVAVSGTFSYKSTKGIMNDEAVESRSEFTAINQKIEEARKLLEDAAESGVGVDEQARQEIQQVTAQLAETTKELEPIVSQYYKDSRGKVNLFIETPYDGGNQPYHPSVQRFDTPWNGYKYWMAYTPYPYGDDFAENPCIVVSNDLLYWSEPPGLVNPIDSPEAAIPIGIHYWSDTELVYNPDTKNLECWYRGVGRSGGVTIVRKTSSNGVNWSEREVLFTTTGTVHVSHSVIYENGKYRIWLLSPNLYFETTDPKNWGTSRTYTLGDYWHGQVKKTSKGYEYFVHVNWPDNFAIDHFISQDGINFTKTMKVISSHGDMGIPYGIDAAGIYRPCFIIEGGRYYLFYCTGAKDIRKGITLSISENLDLKTLRGIDESFVKYMKSPTKRSMYGFEGTIFDKTDNTMNRCLVPSTTKRVPCKWVTEKIKDANDLFTTIGMEMNTTIDAVSGVQTVSDIYHTSALIPLKANTLLEFTRRRWTVANFYDATKTRISGVSVDGEKLNTAYLRPPSNAHYVRFNYYKAWLDMYTFRQFTDFSAGTTWEQGNINNTGELVTNTNAITTGFLAVNSSFIYKIVDDTTLAAGLATFAEYDVNKNFVKLTSAFSLLTSPITKYVKVTLVKTTGISPSNASVVGIINN